MRVIFLMFYFGGDVEIQSTPVQSLQQILHTFKHIMHPQQPDGEGRHTDSNTHMHTALSAALWVLSVHNMAAIILLAAAEA